jgi:hypothetical protein
MAQQVGPDMRLLWFIVIGMVGMLGVIIAARANSGAVEFAGLGLTVVMAIGACRLIAVLQDEAWGQSKSGH